MSTYTPNGQTFLMNIKRCLQEKLEQLPEIPACSNLKKIAIRTHEECYRENNWCALSRDDKSKVKLTAIRQIFDPAFWSFAVKLDTMCL